MRCWTVWHGCCGLTNSAHSDQCHREFLTGRPADPPWMKLAQFVARSFHLYWIPACAGMTHGRTRCCTLV
jgi:hypothetical protein